MININFEASNQTDWIIYFQAVDEATGAEIDFTGADIAVKINDQNGCTLLTASTDLGSITLSAVGTIQTSFTAAQMQTLCAGSYPIGCVYEINSETVQLFVGSVSVYEGVASI